MLPGIRCEDPGFPFNGGRTGELFCGERVFYTCNRGFVLQGDSQRTCQENGAFDGRLPQCVPDQGECRSALRLINFGGFGPENRIPLPQNIFLLLTVQRPFCHLPLLPLLLRGFWLCLATRGRERSFPSLINTDTDSTLEHFSFKSCHTRNECFLSIRPIFLNFCAEIQSFSSSQLHLSCSTF